MNVRSKLRQGLFKRLGRKATERILRYVMPATGKGCWKWVGGGAGELGRPCVWVKGQSRQVARLFWEAYTGQHLNDYLACHIKECGDGYCVNPTHIYKGTPSQNLIDMWEWGARSKPRESVL